MLLNSDLRLNLFGAESEFHFDIVVCICQEKAIYAYFDEVQKLSIRDQEIYDVHLRVSKEYFH